MEKLVFKLAYDSMVIFDRPILIRNDMGDTIKIYGWCYNKQKMHEEDLFLFLLNRWICYLKATEILLNKSGTSGPDLWIMPDGNKIFLQLDHKNLIYCLMRENMGWYRLYETDGFLNVKEDELEEDFIISENVLYRMGILQKEEKGKEVRNEEQGK